MHHLRDALTLFFIQPLPVFFSAIGLGFMFTEVTLIQKFILFSGQSHILSGGDPCLRPAMRRCILPDCPDDATPLRSACFTN